MRVGEVPRGLEQRPQEDRLRLVGRDDVRLARRNVLPSAVTSSVSRVGADVVRQQDRQELPQPGRVPGGAHDVPRRAGRLRWAGVELPLELQQLSPHLARPLQARQRRDELVADGERERQLAVRRVLGVAAAAGLLEQDADPAVQVRVGRALAGVVVVELLLGEVQRADLVQRRGVVLRQAVRQLEVPLRDQRVRCASGRRAGRSRSSCCPSRGSRGRRSASTGGRSPAGRGSRGAGPAASRG